MANVVADVILLVLASKDLLTRLTIGSDRVRYCTHDIVLNLKLPPHSAVARFVLTLANSLMFFFFLIFHKSVFRLVRVGVFVLSSVGNVEYRVQFIHWSPPFRCWLAVWPDLCRRCTRLFLFVLVLLDTFVFFWNVRY